jgi:hypothetical protein
MEKIRIQNVKTGKVMEITKSAWDQLKRGGHSKNFDVVSNEKPSIKFKVPPTASKPEQPSNPEITNENPIVDENVGTTSDEMPTQKRSRKTTKE